MTYEIVLSENPVNVVILRNDLTKICDDKQGRKQDCDDKIRSPNSDQKYLNKNERVKAPPPPTIRPKSPESPPLKRYVYIFLIITICSYKMLVCYRYNIFMNNTI